MESTEFYKPGFIPYTEKTWNEFKERLAVTLERDGLDSEVLNHDEALKNFIVNFAEKELLSEDKDKERIADKTNIRLANMVIDTSRGQRQFPIVNYYTGHHLMRVKYFRRNGQSIEFGVVEVVEKPHVIIPT